MFGGRFFGGRYFGKRYFGKQGAIVLGRYFGGRYFGRDYYGPRYWGTELDVPFALVVTAGLSVAGVVQTAGNINAPASFNVGGNVGLTGSISVGAVLSFDSEDFAVTPPLEVAAMSGSTSVAGDLVWGFPSAPGDGAYFGNGYFGGRYFGSRYWSTTKPFVLTATNTIQTSGVVGVSGGITTAASVTQTSLVPFDGVVLVAGNLVFGSTPNPGDSSSGGWFVPVRRKKRRGLEEDDAVVASTEATEATADTAMAQAMRNALKSAKYEVMEAVNNAEAHQRALDRMAELEKQIKQLEEEELVFLVTLS